MTQFQGMIDEFHRLDAEVYGISVDSHYTLNAWARELGLSFPLLSDFNREAMRSCDLMLDEYNGYHNVSTRAILIIDRTGTVVYTDVQPPRGMPDIEAALNQVREIAAG